MSAPKRSGIRLIDVAEHAGVSMKTVSNVVRGHPNVSAAMRERVQGAIDELGYRPNLLARRLVTGHTGMVALALPEIDHPYFGELARHVAQLAPQFGFRVVIEQTLADADAERAVIRDRERGLVDGVIFQPIRMPPKEIRALQSDFPMVLLGEIAPPATADHVMIDNVAAAHEATAHLVQRGRQRIAFLGLVESDPSEVNALRLQGYRQAHRDAGLDLDESLVLTCAEYSVAASRMAFAAALGQQSIDAVLCREDRFAIGARMAIAESGADVPSEVAVVGWDDGELSRLSVPSLTSVAPDKEALAESALSLLQQRIGGYAGPGRHVLVPHTLRVRASS